MSIQIHTDRMILRNWSMDDVPGMFELNNDPEVSKFTGDLPFTDEQAVIELIRNYDQYEKYNMGRLTMVEKSSGQYIGWCGLKYLEASGETDLGYRILKKFRKQGYATEAARASLEYGFSNLNLKKIVGRAVRDNTDSIRILKKLGMIFEKEFREHDQLCEQYYLTNELWRTQKNQYEQVRAK